VALKISRTYFHRGHYPLEIVQEANLGLVRALTMFDPGRGIKFFSYAVWWVHAYTGNTCSRIRGECSDTLHFSSHWTRHCPRGTTRTNASRTISATTAPARSERYFSVQRTVLISRILSEENGPLNSREKYILKRRFFEEPRPTLSQLGKKMKISKERIRQIENNSLAKIRNHIQLHHPMVGQDFMENINSGRAGEEILEELRAAG
jgi:RNA polymerase sigma factor (sigma-70 family)